MGGTFEKIQDLVLRARRLPEEERSGWLDEACAGDTALRTEVESLLAHDVPSDEGIVTGGAFLDATDDEPDPEAIGPYRILERIGEGGFGDVFAAEQLEPIRRRVAVKVLKRGMDTRAVLARFKAETQALALMEHPHIARILDAGETDTGRPYFVMDWIKGERITRFCDEEALDVRTRIGLLADVAEAVAHAHRRGVLHRDLKPTNVLVARRDGVPVPTVIDFGIAKAVDAPLTDATVQTIQGQLLGTPAYMSPEQASGRPVTERSDVYALGALLYELLTGRTPVDARTLQTAALDQIPRIIRESEPKPPSTLAIPGFEADCRGELDWVTLTALDHDPDRRYRSATHFAEDLRRFLRGEPVEAPSPSTSYRARKWVNRLSRRSREAFLGVAARTGVSVKLALQARRIAEERDRANREREAAERVADFLSRMLSAVHPAELGDSLWSDLRERLGTAADRARHPAAERDRLLDQMDTLIVDANPTNVALRLLDEEILDRAGRTIDEELSGDPEIAARLRATLGATYRELGLLHRAEPHLRRALGERTRLLGEDHADTISTQNSLVILLHEQGHHEEAETSGRMVLERARRALGEDHRETLAALLNLGVVLAHLGKLDEAETVRRKAMEINRRVLGERDKQTITAIGNLGMFLNGVGKHDEAERYMRECLTLARKWLGPDDGTTISAGNNLAMLLEQTGRSDEAEALMREVLAAYRRVKGDDHMETLAAQSNLATILDSRKNYVDAEEVLREALVGIEKVVGSDHLHTNVIRQNLGMILMKLERMADAEAHLRRAFESNRDTHGADHPHTLNAAGQLAEVLMKTDRLDEAKAMLLDAIERSERALPPSDWTLAILRLKLATIHEQRGDRLAGADQARKARDQFEASLGGDHPRTRDAAERVAALEA